MVIRLVTVPDSLELTDFDDIFHTIPGWDSGTGYAFKIHGREFNSFQRKTRAMKLSDFQLHQQEKFLYTLGTMDQWEWELRVIDRGMVSEDNLEFLRERKASYIVVTPKAQLKKFEQQLTEKSNWVEVHEGLEVKLVEHPDGNGTEQYIMCRSAERREKENSMLELKRQRLLEKLKTIDTSLRKKPM